jgi:hypothetical protein
MKALQKLILPALIIIVIALVYVVYFKSDGGLGSFTDFDPNNSAVKEITVQVLQDRGISNNAFYVTDKTGKIVMVQSDHLPPGIESAQTVVLQGHLSSNETFHAHTVLLD